MKTFYDVLMELQAYKDYVKKITTGKNLPDAIYLHESALVEAPPPLLKFLQKTICILELEKTAWNIVKFSKKEFKFSLLNYPDFFTDSYPALNKSYTIDLNKFSCRTTNYSKSDNPPILHRKETFLLSNHPSAEEFHEITKEGEEAGLYKNTRIIGFKKSWQELIHRNGYELIQGRLKPLTAKPSQIKTSVSTPSSPNRKKRIERHKTAIDRNSLSVDQRPILIPFSAEYCPLDINLTDTSFPIISFALCDLSSFQEKYIR